MNKVKTDHENYERDLESNAVLNNDIASYTAYKKQRDNMLRTMSELDILKNEMVEIKSMLSILINKNNSLG